MRVAVAAAAAALAVLGAAPALRAAPAAMPPQPLRLVDGAQLWTIPDAAIQQFVQQGTLADRQLERLVLASGWPQPELRTALAKPYAVDLVALSRFLDSPAGVAFLQQQTQAFRPLRSSRRDLRIEGLRAAILRSASGGSLSALAILRELPTSFVADLGGVPLQRCSALPCTTPEQCRSLLSWWVFLPACLQAAAMAPAPAAAAATAPL